jgi:tape measure domain-containing protein
MSVQAAQLQANVSVTGADEAIGILNEISSVIDGLISKFTSMPNLNMGDTFAGVADAMGEISGAGDELVSSLEQTAKVLDDTSSESASFSDNLETVGSGMSDLASNISDAVSGAFSRFTESISSMSSAVMDFSSSALENAKSGISSFASGISDASGGFGDFFNSLGMGIMNFQMIGQTAVSTAEKLLGPAASAETMQTAFENLLGSTKAASDEMQKLDTFASQTPFKTMDIDQAAAQLIGFGTNAKDVIPDLKAIGDALSAVGKGSTANLDGVVAIFGKMQLQGKVTAVDMTQLSDRGINAWKVLEDQTGKTQAQLQSMMANGLLPAGDAIKDLTVGIEKNPLYSGGMAKQSATTAGLISTLQSNWDQMLASFGSPILKALEPVINNIGSALSSPVFKNFASTVGQGIVDAIKTFTSNAQIATPILAGLGTMLAVTVVPAVWSLASGVIAATWPILAIGAAVAGAVVVFEHFYNSNAGFKAFINELVGGLKQAYNEISSNFMPMMKKIGNVIQTDLMPFLQRIGAFLISTFKPAWVEIVAVWDSQLLPAFAKLWSALQPLKPLFELIGAVVVGVVLVSFASLLGVINGLAKGLAAFMSGMGTFIAGLVQMVSGAIEFVSGIVRVFIDIFTGNFKDLGPALGEIWQGILDVFGGAWKSIIGLFQAVFGTIWGLISGFCQGFIAFFVNLYDSLVGHSIIPDMINGIINWFEQLPGRVVSSITRFISYITTQIGGLGAKALTWAGDMINQFVQGIENGIGAVGNAVQKIAGKIAAFLHFSKPDTGPLVDVDNWMPDFGNMLSKGLNDQVNKISGASLKLASTMNVNMNPLQGGSGMASSIPSLITNVSGGGTNIVINPPSIYLDGRQLSSGLMPYITNAIRYGVGTHGM